MSLSIEINGETLDLPIGTKLDLERENPFLQFDDQLIGEYSYPFQVLATEKNSRLLGYAGIFQVRVSLLPITAIIKDNGMPVSVGKIKIEKAGLNLNVVSKGVINCYYLTGSSDFYQEIKGKYLKDIDVGGDRTFSLTGASLQASAFGVHINTVLNHSVGVDDYAFYPVINRLWGEDPGATIEAMNLLFSQGPTLGFLGGPIVPFPYLKYVLTKAIEHVGWKIEGNILNDNTFKAITMINFKAIDYGYYKRPGSIIRHSSCTFNLQDHLPDISISSFLIGLKNRFGWWYDFDTASKKIRIRLLKDLVTNSFVDMTGYSSPLIGKNVKNEKDIYGLTQAGFDKGLSLTQLDYQGEVNGAENLPAAAESRSDQVYFIRKENNYYICLQKPDDDSVWQWQILSANIYNYEPEGMTKSIQTDVVIPGLERYDNNYYKMIPRYDSTGIWSGTATADWPVILCFYFGLRIEGSDYVPSASHHIYDNAGTQKVEWSLAYKGEKTDNTEVGLYDLNWKPFLDMLNTSEELELTLSLPMHLYLKLKFSDRLVVDGVGMFAKTVKASIPYKGTVAVSANRI